MTDLIVLLSSLGMVGFVRVLGIILIFIVLRVPLEQDIQAYSDSNKHFLRLIDDMRLPVSVDNSDKQWVSINGEQVEVPASWGDDQIIQYASQYVQEQKRKS